MILSSCGRDLKEAELPASAIMLIDCASFGFYRGAAGIHVSGEGLTFDVTTSHGSLGNVTLGFTKTNMASVPGAPQEAEKNNLYVFGYQDDETHSFGAIDSDHAVLRIVIREGSRIAGYALVAFWGIHGPEDWPCFWNGKLLKGVLFKESNGSYPNVCTEKVNELLDRAEKEYVTDRLFKTECSLAKK